MASRIAARFVARTQRSFSGSGKILSEEEKAAENVYIKKIEKEKLEKLARKGPKPEETATASSEAAAKPAAPTTSASGESTQKVSTDKNRNYAVVAGVVTACAALGWYLRGSEKKKEVQD
ncbi:uncharacterized protein At2g27730, mitochondrial [Humulus lupulus]|uniref:uncharacterized protein At2g27730, mitochondrial n=1 Tax=Humulus lupulus TaxID=3486 RepID=UPI002B40871C|nr:uncharacterized protein At2g27730, mitochondrial [Humulus lupulus]